MLGRLGIGGREQRYYLFHWTEDIAVGFHPGKLVLSCALRFQFEGLAEGRNFPDLKRGQYCRDEIR